MAQQDSSSALSGGLLVVIGIVLAVAILYFVTGNHLGMGGGSDKPSVSINMPSPSSGTGNAGGNGQ